MRTSSLVTVIVIATLAASAATAPADWGLPAQPGEADRACAPAGTAYLRTTLYFGLARPTGTVSEAEWQAFLREDVTPRFPDGLTVWEADGQWRRADGSIGRERAKVLLLVHAEAPADRAAVAAVIARYKRAFEQQSVLWETARVCAAF